jgi:hypothetical protein
MDVHHQSSSFHKSATMLSTVMDAATTRVLFVIPTDIAGVVVSIV